MSRYINADRLKSWWTERYNTRDTVGVNQVIDAIENAPTANVKPVVHAITQSWIDRGDSMVGLYTCSNCDMAVTTLPNYHYCEKCGARLTRSTKSKFNPKGSE